MSATNSSEYIKRAFIQKWDGIFPPDYQLVADELETRGIPVKGMTTQDFLSNKIPLTKFDLVVGDFMWTRHALKQLNLPMPESPDYPKCLFHLLHRKIWTSTLKEIKNYLDTPSSDKPLQIFIKPSLDAKAFSAIIEPQDQMLDALLYGITGVMEPLDPNTPVFCSEVVDMIEEHRVYVVNGEIRAICCYRGLK